MLNPYFANRAIASEHRLYDSLIAEAIQIKGTEIYYLPRTLRKEDKVFGEDTLSAFYHAIPLEAYMETPKGPSGDGDIISKFGLEIRDETTFTVSKKRWEEVVGSLGLQIVSGRPNEGDLIFFQVQDLQQEFYQISFVEHEEPFYQMEHIGMYRLKCEMFRYSNELFQTGIPIIDSLHDKTSFNALHYEIALEDGSGSISMETPNSSIILDDWSMEDASREYATNSTFIDEARKITKNVIPENPFGWA